MEKCRELLLENTRQEFYSLVNYSRLTFTACGLDKADSAARTMASAVAIHRDHLDYSLMVFSIKSRILSRACHLRDLLYSQTRQQTSWTYDL